MTEVLITLIFLSLFSTMIIYANRMLSTVVVESVAISQQQTLANSITSAMLIEMRDANNISYFTGGYNDGSTVHSDTAQFVYDSSKFDFLQSDPTITYREVIFVNSSDNKLYVGCAPNSYSLSTDVQALTTGDNYTNAKTLIGTGLYKNNVVKLNDGSTKNTAVVDNPTSANVYTSSDIIQNACFRLYFELIDTVSLIKYEQEMFIYTNIAT